jgi:hypothetical protein
MSMIDKPLAAPLDVEVVDGEVALTAPSGVKIVMTREAAEASGRRLLETLARASADEVQQTSFG